MTKYRAISPFLCMDMTYITCLLKEGFGFKDSTVLQVRESDQRLCLFVCLCVVIMEILLFCSTVSKEGKQRGDKLGSRGDLWLLQKPQHPRRRSLRGTVFHCGASLHPSIHPPVLLAHKPSPTTLPQRSPLPSPSPVTSVPWKNTQRTVEKEKKKKEITIFFIRPAISTVHWAHKWLAVCCLHRFTFVIPRVSDLTCLLSYMEVRFEVTQPVLACWCLLWSWRVLRFTAEFVKKPLNVQPKYGIVCRTATPFLLETEQSSL